MRKYAIPLYYFPAGRRPLYNIVDQIFIANASYLGSYGNAANTVVFPLTVVAVHCCSGRETAAAPLSASVSVEAR